MKQFINQLSKATGLKETDVEKVLNELGLEKLTKDNFLLTPDKLEKISLKDLRISLRTAHGTVAV